MLRMKLHAAAASRPLTTVISAAVLFAAALAASSVGAPAHGTEPTLEARLAKLTEDLETQRQELHIPGMAMAVVQGDELIYSHGFGSANLENSTPVTPETLFAIGSSTKAFTASLIGMLVDEGKMSWDDPVTKFLPYFELKIDTEDPEATVTIRDLLSHRTGFTRMGMLWAGGAVTRHAHYAVIRKCHLQPQRVGHVDADHAEAADVEPTL